MKLGTRMRPFALPFVVLFATAVTVSATPEQNLRASKTEAMAAISISSREDLRLEGETASILVMMNKAQEDLDEPANDARHLEDVASGLLSLYQRNLSAKVTKQFVDSMTQSLKDYEDAVPNTFGLVNAHLRKLLKRVYKCEAQYKTDLTGAGIHDDHVDPIQDVHEDCRAAEADAKQALEACRKGSAGLKDFLDEDTACKEWPALKAMKASSAVETCHAVQEGETYEEYLERMRNQLDSELMLYQQMKSMCAAREKPELSCDTEEITYKQKKDACDTTQSSLEHTVCLNAQKVRNAWNAYAICWRASFEEYEQEARNAWANAMHGVDSYLASQQIECLLGGFNQTNQAAVKEACKEQRAKAHAPKKLLPEIGCPPHLKEQPKMPVYPGSGGYREEAYDKLPDDAPASNSTSCPVTPPVYIKDEKFELNCSSPGVFTR
eukprot:TRINITY_DN111414_c0_g1_i1.p1 TRINITY_DN111414_c0_g1~~TRINITY_DN111414_c0_g1_i1.p1  ORF type:complete len:438 (-),score=99.71 TRINITY_DN111414_c0_g1_i1:30-1343(-)